MKKLATFAFLCALMLGAVGCGGPVPVDPMTTPDTGPAPDAAPPGDRATPPDAAVDTPVPPADRPTPGDAPATDTGPDTMAEICRPTLEPPARDCMGAALCRPNFVNPTCAGAMACTCDLHPGDMPPMLCTEALMPTCLSLVSCAPGRNHCSIHLPEGVDYVPFRSLEAVAGHGGLRQTVQAGWISEDRMVEASFQDQPVIDSRGFVQVCLTLPRNPTIPATMQGMTACAVCSGLTCYWNRGGIRAMAPSIEIRFREGACGYERRLFAPGAEAASQVLMMVSLSTACN